MSTVPLPIVDPDTLEPIYQVPDLDNIFQWANVADQGVVSTPPSSPTVHSTPPSSQGPSQNTK